MKLLAAVLLAFGTSLFAQPHVQMTWSPTQRDFVPVQPVSTSTDLFIMPGTDFDRPGLVPRANLNIGIGHSFNALSNSPVGNELTFSYTYENAGTHGWWHTQYGSHTESLGVMRNFNLTKNTFGAYTWIMGGLTSMTGNTTVENRFYNGEAAGLVIHFTPHHGIWIQEMYNKVVTVPWYTTTGIGYTYSW